MNNNQIFSFFAPSSSSMVSSLLVLLMMTITLIVSSSSSILTSAADIQVTISGSSSSSELTSEGLWLGEHIDLTISGDPGYNWSSSLSSTCFETAMNNRNSTERNGCRYHGICQNQSDVVNVTDFNWVSNSATTTTMRLKLTRAFFFGYRDIGGGTTNDSIIFNFTEDAGCFTGSPTGLPVQSSIPIKGYMSNSIASAVSEASTELDIRLQSNKITFSILYSAFISADCFAFTLPAGITGDWSATTFPTIEAVFTLDQNSNYNISSNQNIQVSFYSASTDEKVLADYYSGRRAPNPLQFTFPIAAIVGPRTPCTILNNANNIYEADLRAGTVPLVYVTFVDTDEEQFIPNWNDTQKSAFVNLTRFPPRIQVSVSSVNTSTLALQFSASSPASTYELDASQLVTMRVPDRQLRSGEVGCGTFTVNVRASPGVIVGKEYIAKTEAQVMTESMLLHFYLKHDEFSTTVTNPTVVTNVIQAESGTVPVDAENSGFDVTMRSRLVVTIVNTTYATVLIPNSTDYNIPTKVTEMINISFPASVMRSDIAPIMQVNNTVNISYIDVVCTAYFRSTNEATISSEYLWQNGAELVLALQGDKWTPGAELIWNRNHPRIRGLVKAENASIEGYSYENLINYYAPVELFNYSTVKIGARVSSLKMIPLRGLVQQFDERVAISQLLSLIRGRPVISEPSFKISAVAPSNIHVKFSGVVDYKNGIRESEIRQGFSLFLNTSFQVFPLATNNKGYELFPGQTSLTNILPNCISGRGGNTTTEWWRFNITCGPHLFDSFDITKTERINIVVPNSFFFGSIKPASVFSTFFDIIADKNVGCFFATDEIKISERDVRTGHIRLDFLVQATDNFQPKSVLDTLPINQAITNQYKQFGLPLGMKFGNTLRSDLVSFGLLRNESYDIKTPDLVQITLNRHFFASGESCTSSLNFTVSVSPGFGNITFHNDTSAIQSDDIKSSPIYFSIYFTEEQLADWVIQNNTFDLRIYGVSKTGSANPLGASGMVADFGWKATVTRNAPPTTAAPPPTTTDDPSSTTTSSATSTTSSPSSSSGGGIQYPWHRFDGVLPAQPRYRISGDEDIVFEVPGNVVVSGLSPVLTPNRISVKPAASGVSVSFADAEGSFPDSGPIDEGEIFTVNESLMFRGGLQINITLLEDMWRNNVTGFQLMRQKITRTHEDGSALDPFLEKGNLNAIFDLSKFVLVDNNTLRITTSPDNTYNAMQVEVFTLFFEASSTVTGFAPRRNNITWRVVPEAPYVTATGPALFIGSTDFIDGGAYIDIQLHNDNFVIKELVGSVLCNFQNQSADACEKITTEDLRSFRLRLFERPDIVVERNTTYPIQIPEIAITSNNSLNVINLVVYLQRGVATISLPGSPLTVSESSVRQGILPPFVVTVRGDVFVTSLADISGAIATAVTCFDPNSVNTGGSDDNSGTGGGDNNNNNGNSNNNNNKVVDPFGFCGRAPYLFAAKKARLIDSQTVSVEMQPDEDFDIAKTQSVNITFAATGVVSGLVPLGHLIVTITPESGTYRFSASRTTVTTAEVSRDPDFVVDIVFSLTSERFIADPTAILVESATSSQSIAAEANGFARNKLSMFLKAQVSANGRVAKLSMIGNSAFALLRAETISFFVSRLAVVSDFVPQPEDATKPRTVTIVMSGGELTMLTPTTVASDVFSSGSFNVSIRSTTAWDIFAVGRNFISGTALSQVMNSDKSAAVEPTGFSALRNTLLPQESLVDSQTLTLVFRQAPTYKLSTDEVITLTIPGEWTANGHSPFPSSFTITVSHFSTAQLSIGSLVFYIPSNVQVSTFISAVVTFAGLAPELVKVMSSTIYPRGNGRFRVVSLLFNDMSNRPATQAADFIRNSDPNLIRSVLNVTAVMRPEEVNALSAVEMDQKLGIRATVIYQDRERTSWWVWVAVAFIVFLVIGGYFLYQRVKKRFLNLNASTLKTFQMGSSAPGARKGGRGGGLFGGGGSAGIREIDDDAAKNDNPLLALQHEEEEEELLQGLYERYGKGSRGGAGGVFLNSASEGLMVSGLSATTASTNTSSKSISSRTTNQRDIDDMMMGNNNSSNNKLRRNKHKKLTEEEEAARSMINDKTLQFLGDDRGPNVEGEFEVSTGQQAPSLSSRVRAFRDKRVDVDETLCAGQPAHVFGVERAAMDRRIITNTNTKNSSDSLSPANSSQGRYRRAGQYDEDFVDPQDRYNDDLDGIAVFPPTSSLAHRPLSNWRKTKHDEIQKADPLQQGNL